MGLIRNDEADIRVSVNGKPYFGSWQAYDGGALTATSAKTRAGGMGQQRNAGGPRERADITVNIDWDDVVAGYFNELEAYVGSGNAVVSVQFLNPDRSAIAGAHFTRTGKVTDVHFDNVDSRTTSPAIGMLVMVIAADELAG